MGWTFTHRPKGLTTREWFERNLSSDQRFLATATKDGVFYAAVENLPTATYKPGAVWGLVTLTKWTSGHHNYGWKDMDETMGPYEANCPDRILDLLTPIDSEWANEWRARCRANNAARAARPKVKIGDTVRFAVPLTFTNGDTADTFTYEGGSRFRAGHQGYRITRWKERTFEVVS